jgi:hypothetical protein
MQSHSESESRANGPAGRTVWHFTDWRKANRIVTNLDNAFFRVGTGERPSQGPLAPETHAA